MRAISLSLNLVFFNIMNYSKTEFYIPDLANYPSDRQRFYRHLIA